MSVSPSPRSVRIPALDGYPLAADVWEPDARASARPAVVINSAMGVHRRFYRAFASHLAGRGLCVVGYDYRGIGESAPGRLRGFPARARDWSQLDFAGVLRWLSDRRGGRDVAVVGHSIGGQLLGLAPDAGAISSALLVGAQAGSWRHWSGLRRLGLAALWFAAVPAFTASTGKLPMRWFGLGENVPAGVAREWALWGRSPEYLFDPRHRLDVSGYQRLAIPMRAYSFADDRYAPRPAVEALLRRYSAARIDRRHLGDTELRGRRVGHFGFFRAGLVPDLWQEAADWLTSGALLTG